METTLIGDDSDWRRLGSKTTRIGGDSDWSRIGPPINCLPDGPAPRRSRARAAGSGRLPAGGGGRGPGPTGRIADRGPVGSGLSLRGPSARRRGPARCRFDPDREGTRTRAAVQNPPPDGVGFAADGSQPAARWTALRRAVSQGGSPAGGGLCTHARARARVYTHVGLVELS